MGNRYSAVLTAVAGNSTVTVGAQVAHTHTHARAHAHTTDKANNKCGPRAMAE